MSATRVLEQANSEDFGELSDGRAVRLYRLASSHLDVAITDYGARIVSMTPRGSSRSVVLGYESAAAYEADPAFFGACCGRFANRIANGAYGLDDRLVRIATNDGPHALHGGPDGFYRRLWRATYFDSSRLVLELISPGGDQGFEGEATVRVTFEAVGERLSVSYHAETDAPTPISLTHHPYFNLSGEARVDDHEIAVDAIGWTPNDAGLIPVGHIEPFSDDRFDLRAPTRLIDANRRVGGRGLDHNLVLGEGRRATLSHAEAGLALTVETDQPCLQVYSGGAIGGGPAAAEGTPYRPFEGVCLEPQWYPDAPNQPDFPSSLLRPGEVYEKWISYTLSTVH